MRGIALGMMLAGGAQVFVSYLEIYNDAGYDLLDPGREAARMEDLPRVSVYEDEDGVTRLRNLALHPAATEEAALNLVSAHIRRAPTPCPGNC